MTAQPEVTTFGQNVKLSDEQKTELKERLRTLGGTIAANEKYQLAVRKIIAVVDSMIYDAQKVNRTVEPKRLSDAEWHANQAMYHIKRMLEHFANDASLDGIVRQSRELTQHISADPDLHAFYNEAKQTLEQLIITPDVVDSVDFDNTMDRYKIIQDNHKTEFLDLLHSVRLWLAEFKYDPLNVKLAQDIKILVTHLLYDDAGKLAFKPAMIKDMGLLIPILFEQIAYIPISRIEHEDDKFSYVLENVVLDATKLLPTTVELEAGGKYEHHSHSDNESSLMGKLRFRISGIQISANNAAMYFTLSFFKMGHLHPNAFTKILFIDR